MLSYFTSLVICIWPKMSGSDKANIGDYSQVNIQVLVGPFNPLPRDKIPSIGCKWITCTVSSLGILATEGVVQITCCLLC